jgi:hypothetical protein
MCLPFPGWLVMSNFSSVPMVFCRFCIWIAVGDADLHFLLILVTKANGVEGGITSAA